MNRITYVPLRNDLLVRLIGRDGEHYGGLVEYAVEDYLDRTDEDHVAGLNASGDGYSWDQVYLPEGTLLRTRYKGAWLISEVTNGCFSHNGQSFGSPSKVCNAMRGDTSNNAWITLEVKRPQDVDFRLADKFRR